MMDQWTYHVSAQLVDRIQREGVEVVESSFEQEQQPGRLRRLVTVLYQQLRQRGEQRRAETARIEGTP
jgi:hypothetical protein